MDEASSQACTTICFVTMTRTADVLRSRTRQGGWAESLSVCAKPAGMAGMAGMGGPSRAVMWKN